MPRAERIEPTLMMQPSRWRIITGATAREQ
jgi:hypothetical protein